MSQNLIWSLGLLLTAAVCLVLEFMIPSAGLLGAGAAIALIGALFLAFSESTSLGMTMSGGVAIVLPIILFFAVQWWPRTPIGRRMLNLPHPDDFPDSELRADDRMAQLRQLVGRVGVARTHLLPGGMIEVDGRRYDAVAQGTAIDRDSFVEIFSVDAGKIRVRPTNRRPSSTGTQSLAEEAGDSLASRSLEELNLEDLGDPLQ